MFDLLKNSEKLDLLNDQLFYFTTKQHEYVSKIVYKKTDEWYIEWQRVITSGKTSGNEIKTSDNEWQQVAQRMTTSDNKEQQVTTNDNE